MPVRLSSLAGFVSAPGVGAGARHCRVHTGQCQWRDASGRLGTAWLQRQLLALPGCYTKWVAAVETSAATMQHAPQRLVGGAARPAMLGCLPDVPERRCKPLRAGTCGTCCPSVREASAAC